MPFSALGRGLGAAGSAIGSAASRVTSFSGSDGDRPKSPERRSREASLRRTKSLSNGKKGADDEEKSIFATSLANLSPAELEALGMKFGVNGRLRARYAAVPLAFHGGEGAVRAIATLLALTHPGVACAVVRGICVGRRRGTWEKRDPG